MYHIKNDRRSVRSAESIYDALAILITRQPFETIKVSELVEQAQVGRATFYRNFDTTEDVLRWRCDQVVEALMAYLAEYRRSQPADFGLPLLKPVLRFFYLHSSIVELLIAAQRIDILQLAIQKNLEQRSLENVAPLDVPAEYLVYGPIIRSTAAVGVLAHWVQGGKREAPDALADDLAKAARQMSKLGLLL